MNPTGVAVRLECPGVEGVQACAERHETGIEHENDRAAGADADCSSVGVAICRTAVKKVQKLLAKNAAQLRA